MVKNETKSKNTAGKASYRNYVEDITSEKIYTGWTEDRDRLVGLYKEAIGEPIDPQTGEEITLFEKLNRLTTAMLSRLNPLRRIIFASSVAAFILHYLTSGTLSQVLLPLSFLGVAQLLIVELLEKLDAHKEIDFARQLQISLFPKPNIDHQNLRICSFATTAREVGGDYVDIIHGENGTYYIIADVSGKGLSASLYMIRLQAMVSLLIKKNEPTPKELLVELNNHIKSGKRDKTFVTACIAYFPKETDHFLFARAGHNGPIYFNRQRDDITELLPKGFALGMTNSGLLRHNLQEINIPFEPGDCVLFYTDGLVEARNDNGQEFETQRLKNLMDIYGSLDAKSIVQKIQFSLDAFIGNTKPLDDITFTAVEYKMKEKKEVKLADQSNE